MGAVITGMEVGSWLQLWAPLRSASLPHVLNVWASHLHLAPAMTFSWPVKLFPKEKSPAGTLYDSPPCLLHIRPEGNEVK